MILNSLFKYLIFFHFLCYMNLSFSQSDSISILIFGKYDRSESLEIFIDDRPYSIDFDKGPQGRLIRIKTPSDIKEGDVFPLSLSVKNCWGKYQENYLPIRYQSNYGYLLIFNGLSFRKKNLYTYRWHKELHMSDFYIGGDIHKLFRNNEIK